MFCLKPYKYLLISLKIKPKSAIRVGKALHNLASVSLSYLSCKYCPSPYPFVFLEKVFQDITHSAQTLKTDTHSVMHFKPSPCCT